MSAIMKSDLLKNKPASEASVDGGSDVVGLTLVDKLEVLTSKESDLLSVYNAEKGMAYARGNRHGKS
jgi:hypothetical protein